MPGIDAFATELRRDDGTGTFVKIGNVTNIGGPGLERETYDVTAHDSPQQWREFLGGLKDGGEVSADLNYDPDKHDVLVADLDDPDPISYELAFPTVPETVWQVDLILTGFEPEAPHDGQLAASIAFKVTGAPVLA